MPDAQTPAFGDQRLPPRFWAKIAVGDDGCWVWVAGRNEHGYGLFKAPGPKQTRAHRYAYTVLVGAIPEGLVLDHVCCVRACVNPAHLEPVTQTVNMARGWARRNGQAVAEFSADAIPDLVAVAWQRDAALRQVRELRAALEHYAKPRRYGPAGARILIDDTEVALNALREAGLLSVELVEAEAEAA